MWSGNMEVTLTTGAKCTFMMWHNFTTDDGSVEWKPQVNSPDEYKFAWRMESVCQSLQNPNSLVPVNWYTVHVEDHVYVSLDELKDDTVRQAMATQIRNNTHNKDRIWQLF